MVDHAHNSYTHANPLSVDVNEAEESQEGNRKAPWQPKGRWLRCLCKRRETSAKCMTRIWCTCTLNNILLFPTKTLGHPLFQWRGQFPLFQGSGAKRIIENVCPCNAGCANVIMLCVITAPPRMSMYTKHKAVKKQKIVARITKPFTPRYGQVSSISNKRKQLQSFFFISDRYFLWPSRRSQNDVLCVLFPVFRLCFYTSWLHIWSSIPNTALHLRCAQTLSEMAFTRDWRKSQQVFITSCGSFLAAISEKVQQFLSPSTPNLHLIWNKVCTLKKLKGAQIYKSNNPKRLSFGLTLSNTHARSEWFADCSF